MLDFGSRAVTFDVMMWPAVKLYPLVTAICLSLAISGPVSAQEAEDRMSGWLSELSSADKAEAVRLSREIERAWAQSGSTSLDMLLRRGREAMDEKDIEAAIEHLTALTDHAPDFAEGYHARARAFFMDDQYGPALGDLQQAIALNPKHYNAIFGLGSIFAAIGEYARAEIAFNMVLDLHPHHEQATEALEALKRFGVGQSI